MTKALRTLLFLICAIEFFFALAFFLQWPVAMNLWPFLGTTPLTFVFVSSIFAAAAAPTLWVAISQNYGALAGIGLDYFAVLAPLSVLSFRLGASSGNPQMTAFGLACVLGALFGVGIFLWSVRIRMDITLPMPRPVRWSFAVFIIGLLFVGVGLILNMPNVIPWTVTPELSGVIGWTFLGAASYFVYALLRPSWLNSAGQLIGFLAYDVVLIVPFLTRLPTTVPEFRVSLTVYTAVLIYSGLLAIYYLFLHKPTRLLTKGS
ncbi:MAG: hypothetical protein A2V88_06835 [Elusimicrobia bacterium RBG_16_66_12]|nr:MAG: hypothetical protein A2V88_06835 [Elusimicrobia bacterium RBG_16_66_12]